MFVNIKRLIVSASAIPFGWKLWWGLIFFVNMIIPLIFYRSHEAQMTLLAFFMVLGLGGILFACQGYTRLLALMHLPWVGLIFYLSGSTPQTILTHFFGFWVRAVIILNGIVVVLDFLELLRYIWGERESTVGFK